MDGFRKFRGDPGLQGGCGYSKSDQPLVYRTLIGFEKPLDDFLREVLLKSLHVSVF